MYSRDRGELLYSPDRGYYYENDDKNRGKSIIIVVLVLLFSALSGYIAYKFIEKPLASTKTIKQKEEITTNIKENEKEPQIEKITKPIIDKNISQNIEKPIIEQPIQKSQEKKVENKDFISQKTTDNNDTQEPIFQRGNNSTFFTSMGKSVDGAKIEQNIQKVELKVIDTKKLREELSKKEKNKTTNNKKETTFKVKKGDTIYKISREVYGDSRKYKIILKANGITKPNDLKIGQVLRIPHD